MKTSTLLAAAALPILAAFAPAAVITPMGNNPLAGLPTVLPSPLSGPYAGVPSVLPQPALLPTLPVSAIPAAAPAPRLAPAAPVALPSLPSVRVTAERENAPNPLRRVLPDTTIRFAATVPAKSKDSAEAEKQRQDRVFDGEKDAPLPGVSPFHEPSVNGRHISLPEWDLEHEIGVR
jgi:hypothetical protein